MELHLLQAKMERSDWLRKLLWVLLLVYPMLFIWQGGDLTDTGYALLKYHFFFDQMATGDVNWLIFLTEFIGATWMQLLPIPEVIGNSFLYVVFLTFSVQVSLRIFWQRTTNSTLLVFTSFVALTFIVRFSTLQFTYDIASWAFQVGMLFFLLKGWTGNRRVYLLLSGAFFACAVLCRVSSIALLLFVPLVWCYWHWVSGKTKGSIGSGLRYSGSRLVWSAIGVISVLAVFLVVTYKTGSLETTLAPKVSTNSDSHTIASLLMVYLNDTLKFIPHLLIVIVFFITIDRAQRLLNEHHRTWVIIAVCSIATIAAFLTYCEWSYRNLVRYLGIAICVVPVVYVLVGPSRLRKKWGTIAALALSVSLTQVAGTNTGLFLKMHYGSMLLMPISVLAIFENGPFNIGRWRLDLRTSFLFLLSMVVVTSVLLRFGWIYHAGEGIKIRAKAVHPIDHPKMKGFLATATRADHIGSLSSAIDSLIKPENTLFIFGHQPMFYFLSEQKPPIEKFWLVNNATTAEKTFTDLQSSIQQTRKWPLIVDTKDGVLQEKGAQMLQDFLESNGYRKVMERPKFIIWARP